MTFGFLWRNFYDYPKKIVYHNSTDDTEDVIKYTGEMEEFAYEHMNTPVNSWNIKFSNSTLSVNM